MDLKPHDILWIVQGMIILVLSIAVHEFGHAIVADLLGDDTPRRQGRVTLNPAAHADPMGTLILPLATMIWSAAHGGFAGAGFGWGRPVEHNPRNLTRKLRVATGQLLIAIAGPMMNILFGTTIVMIHVLLIKFGVVQGASQLSQALTFAAGLNYLLFFFNLLPVPPLDGGWVLEWFTPYRFRRHLEHYQVYAPFVFMAVVFIPQLQFLFVTPAHFVTGHVYQLFIGLFGLG